MEMRSEKIISIGITLVSMFALWLIFSAWNLYLVGYYDISKVLSGIVVTVIVTLLMHEFLSSGKTENLGRLIFRYIQYTIWLFYQIFLAAIDVSLRVLGIRDVDPRIIEFTTPLRSENSITTLANSITLTPGTITIDTDESGRFLVHAIASEPASSLAEDRIMIEKVAHVFMEGGNDSPN
ncbi:MAG: Na+/H+ antiporter subunit E [Archaeoglobaceae archaeon]